MQFKMKMAMIFQPYLIVSLLGLFGAYGQYTHSENKYMALVGLGIFLPNFLTYLYLLFSKALVLRSPGNVFIIGIASFTAGIGQGNYSLGVTSSVLTGFGLLLLYGFDFKMVRDIVNKNDFIKNINNKPELTIFWDDSLFDIFKRNENRKMKFSNAMYTYINNEVIFDYKGVKGTTYSFEDVKKYMEDSFVSIKDFNKDSLKTIEMLKY